MEREPVIRWRACHVMGSVPDGRFREALLDRLINDANENVRYGAIRSLIELGSHTSDLAGRLVDDLEPRLETISAWPRIMTELKRAVFLSKGCAPEGWSMAISRLFYARSDLATDPTELEDWSRLSSELRQHDRMVA